MNCVQCASPLPDGSAFCNLCGAAQSVDPAAKRAPEPLAAAPAPRPATPLAPAAPADEREETLWTGRPSGKSLALHWVVYVVYAGAMLYVIYGWLMPENRLIEGALLAATALPAAWLLAVTAVRKFSMRYKLTSQRLFKEEGILSRTVSEVELMRIDDVSVRQTFVDRMFAIGDVLLVSSDASDPRIEIVGVADPLHVKERIRETVQKRRGRIVNVERL